MKKKHIFICAVSFIFIFICFAIVKIAGFIIELSNNRQNTGTVLQNEASSSAPVSGMLSENANQPDPETITPAAKPDTNEAVPTIIAENSEITEAPPKESSDTAESDKTSPDTAESDETSDTVIQSLSNKNDIETLQETEIDAKEPDPTLLESIEITYNALFTKEGEAYTLIADSITNSFLVLDNANKTIRPTQYQYISYFEELSINPILGSSGDLFVFLAHHEVIASDGKREWVLTTVGEADTAEKMGIGYIVHNENRILADIFSQSGHVLLIIDLNTAATYKFPNRVGGGELIVFADDSILFGEPTGNMTTGYYCTLYKVQGGEIETIGVIPRSDTYEYTLESNIVNIKLGDLNYWVDLESNQITSSVPVSDELRLYYPVFCNTTIGDLTEMKFIHNNVVQSIKLPDGWTSYCTYFGEKWFFGFEPKDANIRLLPYDGYFNRLEPYENRPIQKFPESAAVKEQLYSGACFIGECEIYLLERLEPYNVGGAEQNVYEMVYAFIPYEDGLKSYELNIYVPLDKSYEDYYAIMKTMLGID